MLINDLYTYQLLSHKNQTIDAVVTLNGRHPVYGGHFPGFPITPGVLQVLIIQEILESELELSLEMSGAKFIKFTAMHEPGKSKEIEANISYSIEKEIIRANGTLFLGDVKFIKFRGDFVGKAE
jgi:3-hydroxyacyl-[acyl-carrier-protein] dehydratase